MFSFVVVASYAAALPQPAELSEKYSNNVDATLASGLEARSYQPGLNSYKDSATLVSLKRRDDSEGSSGENSGSDSFLPSTLDPNEPFKSPFTDDSVSSMNLASTIDNVGDGNANLYKDGEKIRQKISGPAGDMVTKYIRKNAYVNVALRHWVHESVPGILKKIKSLWGDDEYSRLELDLKKDIKKWEDEFRAGLNAIVDATTNILKDFGPVGENLQKIGKSFQRTLFNRGSLIWELFSLLRPFESSKALLGYLGGISFRALLTSPRVDRQTAVADHFVIRTSIREEAQRQPPAPRAPTISRHHCLEATDRIATSNYWDVLADGTTDNTDTNTDTDTDIHQLTSQFLESANAVADNLSLRLSPPATRSNRRLLSGTTKRAILASNTARQAFIAAATTNRNPDPVQCNTLRDEWSRLKATATQLERVDGRKQ
ncbi:hypothetical protein BASA81_016052 [Batrachochytrium salamandrivorans]|nr:hypothetical protein BASA81_016052 [Batrachochytrium salamandrivorans]